VSVEGLRFGEFSGAEEWGKEIQWKSEGNNVVWFLLSALDDSKNRFLDV
jgi:hypothetical protein